MDMKNPGFLRRFWNAIRKPSAKYSILTLVSISFVGGILFWGGFNTLVATFFFAGDFFAAMVYYPSFGSYRA